MHWDSVHAFFNMGGYAFYVWGSFGLTLLAVVWEVVGLSQRRKQAIRVIKQASLLKQAGVEQTN